MLTQDYTSKLLNLEDVIITNVEKISVQFQLYIELPRKKHVCPVCGDVTAMRYFNLFNKRLTTLPEVISLDEFKGNSGGQKYNSIIVDPKEKTVLDVLPNRFEGDLVKYFSRFPNKNGVKYFICDMNPQFRQVAKICFPQATIVADKYHVIRQVCWAMEKVRKNEQNKLSSRFRKYFKKSRNILMKRTENLSDEEALSYRELLQVCQFRRGLQRFSAFGYLFRKLITS